MTRAVIAAAWGVGLKVDRRRSCEGCRGGCRYDEHDSAIAKYGIDAGKHVRRLGAYSIADLGLLWDACPLWYRDQCRHRDVARLIVRWARRWQPGAGPEVTPLGDDMISIVRRVDLEIADRERKEREQQQ